MKKILFMVFVVVFTVAGCASTGQKREALSVDNEKHHRAILNEGVAVLKKGKIEESVKNYMDPLIEYYENKYKDGSKAVFCARTNKESAVYIAMVIATAESIMIESDVWAEALFYKAYAEVEFKNYDQAKSLLERSIKLSPYNSGYFSELGHIYQIEKNWEKSLEIFKKAEKYAGEYSPDKEKEHELTRAMRGIGYTLIEMGRLDEAEEIYKKCLQINSNDRTALNELEYIKQLRKKQ
ncbi:MAG TPA: tetratricopeptide repeat protein [bacterium]|nr:tetratricopeptide repeat protein [bacterium]